MPRNPLAAVRPMQGICLELRDHSVLAKSAVELFAVQRSADPPSQAARLADQFIAQNRSLFGLLSVSVRRDYDGRDLFLLLESDSTVGAVPLRSPLTAKLDYGLIVQPRFPWPGIGPMLAEMGWLVSPTPLRLPLLKRSERKIPSWVLSFMVLARLQALLNRLERRFEIVRDTVHAPKGSVNWAEYASRYISHGDFLLIPCTFPDLRDDLHLKGAIRFTIEKHLRSLESQRESGSFVHRLIAFAESLCLKTEGAPSRRPSSREIESWLRKPLSAETFLDGLQAIDWTMEDRGLAGMSDLEGVPWTMPMAQFFEAWVETIFKCVARNSGGTLKTGRSRETVSPISWEPSFVGSQKSLVPDLILEAEGLSVIIDAKYKSHWEEMGNRSWHLQGEELREQHRADLLQVLAYANLSGSARVVCCLVYPCTLSTWESLKQRNRLFHRASLPYRGRQIDVWLTAVPMHAHVDRISQPVIEQLRSRMTGTFPPQ